MTEWRELSMEVCKGWIRTVDRKPDEEYKAWKEAGHRDDPQFIVYIRFAKLTTCLYYDGQYWVDEYGDAYDVTHWMNMPEVPV